MELVNTLASILLKESGIRNIIALAQRYPKAEIYFHQDTDGVTTALAMKNYLESYGIEVIGSHVIQYGDKEFSVQKPLIDKARGDVMPVLVDFAHGKPQMVIHTDHHDSQTGVEGETSTQFRGARSNVETMSQIVSPQDIFPNDDIRMISTIDSADYAKYGIDPEEVMNYLYDLDKESGVPKNRQMLALLTNKLLLAYKNKPGFLEELVMTSKPSILNIYNNIRRIAKDRGFATPEEMQKHQESYVEAQSNSKNVTYEDGIISQYGGGSMFKPGSYDRYTPFKLYPDANFLVIAWPMGLVQASCNPFKEDRAIKGVNLGEVAKEVLNTIKPGLEGHMVPISVIKRIGETKADEESIGFKSSDLYAAYKDKLHNMPERGSEDYSSIIDIIDTPWENLSEEQKTILDNIKVSAWDIIESNSGGHKCITNISGLNFFSRATRNPEGTWKKKADSKPTRYVEMVKWVQQAMVKKLKEMTKQ